MPQILPFSTFLSLQCDVLDPSFMRWSLFPCPLSLAWPRDLFCAIEEA